MTTSTAHKNTPQYEPRSEDERIQQHDRSGRFVVTNGNWFFKTREGIDYGPYASRIECKYAYSDFIDIVSAKNSLGAIPIGFGDKETIPEQQFKIEF